MPYRGVPLRGHDYTLNDYIVKQGYLDAGEGKNIQANPYPLRSEPAERWKTGWNMKTLAGESGGHRERVSGGGRQCRYLQGVVLGEGK